MDFINQTLSWVKGEITESIFIIIISCLTIVSALLFWKFGTTPHSKTITIPLIAVGLLLASTGVSMYFSNQKRLATYQNQYQENPTDFIHQEKKRVEDFQYMYVISKVVASISFAFAIYAFWFSKNDIIQSIAIALLIFGVSGLIIDYFSEERASIYYSEILRYLN
jgi:O-antigen/teichoic acid export membrane protein